MLVSMDVVSCVVFLYMMAFVFPVFVIVVRGLPVLYFSYYFGNKWWVSDFEFSHFKKWEYMQNYCVPLFPGCDQTVVECQIWEISLSVLETDLFIQLVGCCNWWTLQLIKLLWLLFILLMQSVEGYSLSRFGKGLYHFTMRGRLVDPYKRVASREHIISYDKEENPGLFCPLSLRIMYLPRCYYLFKAFTYLF